MCAMSSLCVSPNSHEVRANVLISEDIVADMVLEICEVANQPCFPGARRPALFLCMRCCFCSPVRQVSCFTCLHPDTLSAPRCWCGAER